MFTVCGCFNHSLSSPLSGEAFQFVFVVVPMSSDHHLDHLDANDDDTDARKMGFHKTKRCRKLVRWQWCLSHLFQSLGILPHSARSFYCIHRNNTCRIKLQTVAPMHLSHIPCIRWVFQPWNVWRLLPIVSCLRAAAERALHYFSTRRRLKEDLMQWTTEMATLATLPKSIRFSGIWLFRP